MWKFSGNQILLLCLIGCVAVSHGDQNTMPLDITMPTILSTTNDPTSTTTTKPVKTTTMAPTTTSVIPTNSTTTSSTTTEAPPITTTVAPTPKPTPYPKPSKGVWRTDCVLVQLAAQFNFTYHTKDNTTNTGLFNLPVNATVDKESTCLNQTQQIEVSWGSQKNPSSFLIEFHKNNDSTYSLYNLFIKLQPDTNEYPDAKENQTVQMIAMGYRFKTPVNMSYHCTRVQELNMTNVVTNNTVVVGKIALMDVQLEAFRTNNSTKFSTAKDCDAMDTPDIVPIAVGIALIVLILIVLISYLFARRRSTARGYMSF